MHEKTVPPFFVMIYTTTFICSLVLTNKIIDFHGYYISACLFVFPLIFIYSDITAELYGYRQAKKLLSLILIANILFSVCISLTLLIRTPIFYDNNEAYYSVFSTSIRFAIVGCIAIWGGVIVNSYLIAKWKILTRGRYFWLRCVGASCIGELVNSFLAFPLAFTGILTLSQIINLAIVSYVIKILYAIITAFPATIIVTYIKRVKGIDYHASHVNFNPFK